MRGFIARGPRPLRLLGRLNHPQPHRPSFEIAFLRARVRLHGRMNGRILAALVDQELGRAVDVDLTWHRLSLLTLRLSRGASPFTQ